MIYGSNLFAFCRREECRHLTAYITSDEQEMSDEMRPACKAYPKGVPGRIQRGEDKHGEVQPDQEGEWVYERAEKGVDRPAPEVVYMARDEQTPD